MGGRRKVRVHCDHRGEDRLLAVHDADAVAVDDGNAVGVAVAFKHAKCVAERNSERFWRPDAFAERLGDSEPRADLVVGRDAVSLADALGHALADSLADAHAERDASADAIDDSDQLGLALAGEHAEHDRDALAVSGRLAQHDGHADAQLVEDGVAHAERHCDDHRDAEHVADELADADRLRERLAHAQHHADADALGDGDAQPGSVDFAESDGDADAVSDALGHGHPERNWDAERERDAQRVSLAQRDAEPEQLDYAQPVPDALWDGDGVDLLLGDGLSERHPERVALADPFVDAEPICDALSVRVAQRDALAVSLALGHAVAGAIALRLVD